MFKDRLFACIVNLAYQEMQTGGEDWEQIEELARDQIQEVDRICSEASCDYEQATAGFINKVS